MLFHTQCAVIAIIFLPSGSLPVDSSRAAILQLVVRFPISLYFAVIIQASACVAFRVFSLFTASISFLAK